MDDYEINDETKTYAKSLNKVIVAKANNPLLNYELKPGKSQKDGIGDGDTTPNSNDNYAYLTLEKVLSSSENEDKIQYNNYAEIIESQNASGRRNYRTINISSNLTDEEKFYRERNLHVDKINNINGQLLSDLQDKRGVPVRKDNNQSGNYLVLSIPGDIGDPVKNTSTLYFEPDSTKAQEIQVIPPFGEDQRTPILWTTIAIISATAIAGGIYLIKRYVLK